MAQTECTVSPQVVAGASLQISPNLEALLQHDELTRRGAGSPTSIACSTPSSEFAVSLPPPPPRNMHAGKKASPSETRKDVRRRRSFNFKSDSWPDALAPDTAASPANPAIPNPYINPAPVVARFDSPTDDGPPTPRQGDIRISKQRSIQSLFEHRARVASTPEPALHLIRTSTNPRSSPTLHKVERLLTKGKDSLSMLATVAASGSLKLKSDSVDVGPKCYRTESLESFPALQDSPMRQDSVSRQPRLFNTSVTFGNDDAALLDPVGVPIKNKLPPSPLARRYPACDHPTHSELSPTRSLSTSSASSSSSSVHASSANPVHTYPAWSLPNLTFPSMTFNELPRSQSSHSVADSDSRNSFIDLCPPGGVSPRTQGVGHTRPHRQKPSALVIPPSNIYQGPSSNVSSMSLATMIFAPPSPTIDVSPLQHRPSSPSASSIALSTMVFAPPSPATELSPLAVRPSISPSSADSLTPIEFASPASPFSGRRGALEIPTARKFSSLRVGRKAGEKRSLSLSPRPESQVLAPLPPTTNFLGPDERADLIRRNRKLTQVFGQTPGAEVGPLDVPVYKKLKRPPAALTSLLSAGKQRNHRQVMSVSNATSPSHRKTAPSSPWQTDDLWSPTGRRHSTPLTPTSPFTFCLDDTPQAASTSDHHGVHSLTQSPRNSSSSFIDLSDDDDETSRVGDTSVIGSLERKGGRRLIYHSSSTPSLVESLDPDRKAEVERRRMRDKVAKLHRFLGSRVPPDLVLGSTAVPPSPFSDPSSSLSTMEGLRDTLLWGRKGGPSSYQQLFDRGKEELDHKEKAVNVRRAQKMEKVFGTPPPQTLFHTRQGHSTHSQPSSPTVPAPMSNLNQSAYKGKSTRRPRPSESMRCLLPSPNTDVSFLSDYQQTLEQSSVYLNYHHSLNSLVHIIDKDDRESLLELHRYLNSELTESPVQGDQPVASKRDSTTPSIRSERRHSLPVSVSTFSLASVFTSKEVSEFQVRRRRAAKLTSFFGVNYRELVQDILESIERGVEEEHGKGTLQPEEAELLLNRVRSLKPKQDQHD